MSIPVARAAFNSPVRLEVTSIDHDITTIGMPFIFWGCDETGIPIYKSRHAEEVSRYYADYYFSSTHRLAIQSGYEILDMWTGHIYRNDASLRMYDIPVAHYFIKIDFKGNKP
jgi:hypothetical protein